MILVKVTSMKNTKLTLPEYQKLIKKLAAERGFNSETIGQKFMLFLEESGEFSKAARKISGVTIDKKSNVHNLEEEAADVFWLLIDLCNNLGVDLGKSFEQKEKINQKRKWS